MSGQETLQQVRLSGGAYEGIYEGNADAGIEAVHNGKVIAQAKVTSLPDRTDALHVSVDLPPSVLSDGVQVVSLRSTTSGQILDRITFMAGSTLDEDVRGEIALLRDELELLKTAFRRHVSNSS